MNKARPADLQTIFSRLVARNEQLDRQLSAFLAERGLSVEIIDLAAARASARSRRLYAVRERLAQKLAAAQTAAATSWESVTRPSLAVLSAACRGQLLRA